MTVNERGSDTLKYRVDQLEKRFDKVDEKLEKIMTNHLPHIELAMVQVKTRLNVMTAINLGSLLLFLLIQQFIFK